MKLNNFLTSGLVFDEGEHKIQSRYSMVNISFVLSSFALLYAAFHNLISNDVALAYAELGIVLFNIFSTFILRIDRKYFETITTVLCLEYLIFFNLLILFHVPSELKHIWIFTYPIVLLYFTDKHGFYWISAFLATMFIVNFQPFIPTYYSLFQISYLSLDLIIISIIIQLYRNKIDEYEETIRIQNNELENFSNLLQAEVDQKTRELLVMNQNLEIQVEQKVNELLKKDRIILSQSRHAAMGEMISMIAHQWRQPLSNITLGISNLKINSMLREIEPSEVLKKLETISDTILYLSETIDDFQSFFEPNKEKESIEVDKIIKRALSFSMPKAQAYHIEISLTCSDDIVINTHANELVQVLINLINNAIDANIITQAKNALIEIEVKYYKDDKYLLIIVKDYAGGVDEEIKEKIFEPYFSTKGKNGTGIGLYMSKMIIESQIGGKIDFLNQYEGATFRVQIPLT